MSLFNITLNVENLEKFLLKLRRGKFFSWSSVSGVLNKTIRKEKEIKEIKVSQNVIICRWYVLTHIQDRCDSEQKKQFQKYPHIYFQGVI